MNIGYIGITGSGKTIAAVMQGFALLVRNHRFGNTEYRFYSNIKIDLPEPYKKFFTLITSLKQIREMRNGVFLFDEMWKWVDARLSRSKKNSFWSEWAIIARKRIIDLLYTEQYELMIDVRIRQITKYLAEPYQLGVNLAKTIINPTKQIVHDFTVVVLTDLKNKLKSPEPFAIHNSMWFDRYDTYEEPQELTGGTYVDEAKEVALKLISDKTLRTYDKTTKGEIKGHIKAYYGCSEQAAILIYHECYSSDKIFSSVKAKRFGGEKNK